MGASYSKDSELHLVLHRAVLNSSKILAWSKSKHVQEVVDRVFIEVDRHGQGFLHLPEFLKAAALLDVDATREQLVEVFERLDPSGNGYIERSTLYKLAIMSPSGSDDKGTRKKKTVKFQQQELPSRVRKWSKTPQLISTPRQSEHIPEIDDPKNWRKTLRDFEANVEGKHHRYRDDEERKQNELWDTRNAEWDTKLKRAEERVLKKYKGIYQPLKASMKYKPASPRRFAGGGPPQQQGNSRRTRYLESVAKNSTLVELQNLTHFSVQDLAKLRERFFENAMSTSLSVDKFCAFLTTEYPQLKGHQSLLLRLFTLFDADGNGTVSFQEFIMGLTKTLQCSTEDKINLMFSCIDLSSDGKINLQELTHVISKGQGDLQASIAYSREFFQYLDRDASGTVTLDEFKRALKGNEKLYKSLLKALPLPSSAFDVVEELNGGTSKNANSPFSVENLKKLYKEYSTMYKRSARKRNQQQRLMNRAEFRQIMGKHFGLTRLDQQKLLDDLFEAFDEDNSNSVSFEEILRGLSLLINQQSEGAENEACLDFYFDLMDSGNKGILGKEMTKALETSEHLLNREFEETGKFLESLSKQRTSISRTEFMKLSGENPELMQVLQQNFR